MAAKVGLAKGRHLQSSTQTKHYSNTAPSRPRGTTCFHKQDAKLERGILMNRCFESDVVIRFCSVYVFFGQQLLRAMGVFLSEARLMRFVASVCFLNRKA